MVEIWQLLLQGQKYIFIFPGRGLGALWGGVLEERGVCKNYLFVFCDWLHKGYQRKKGWRSIGIANWCCSVWRPILQGKLEFYFMVITIQCKNFDIPKQQNIDEIFRYMPRNMLKIRKHSLKIMLKPMQNLATLEPNLILQRFVQFELLLLCFTN